MVLRARIKEAMAEEGNTKRKRTLPKHLNLLDYSCEQRENRKHFDHEWRQSSSSVKERAKEAAREASLAKLKVEQLKERALLEV